MDLTQCLRTKSCILMEGALGKRLKREYGLTFDENIAMAGLVRTESGRYVLQALWMEYADIAKRHQLPFLATTPTRRANRERMEKACCDADLIYENVEFLKAVRQASGAEMFCGGLMGCRGDAYTGIGALSEKEATELHQWQAAAFQEAGADFLYAGIMPTLPEAAGMAHAMAKTGLPYIISFTIQADGRLIDGTTIHDAVTYIDGTADPKPLCYMTNCVHPRIVYRALMQPFNRADTVQERFLGIQGNTSPLSYKELDNAVRLYSSEPASFAEEMTALREISNIKIFGGCCGTDRRHMEAIAAALSRKEKAL